MGPDRRRLTAKFWKRRLRKVRNRVASWFFDTRFGRELLISNIGPRVTSMTVDGGDHLMSFSPSDYIGRKVFRKGHFERDRVKSLIAVLKEKKLYRDEGVLLELGGNIGTQTVYFALDSGYRHIVSVEPDPRNFALLRANIAQNGLGERVTLVNCAAGETSGEIDFFLHGSNHGKSSAIRQSAADRRIVVPVRPVGDILADAGTSLDAVGLVWMDIEGYEPVACRSMERLMERRVPLYMEFTPVFYGAGAASFVQYLAEFYDECLVFFEEEQRQMKVADIPIDREQFDVLLLR
ncbi:FkbM family methyltransferase [Rhizobium sp. BK251]|uniref:FkbM family methyltransferase n=1 Tax=Rhizobium sp. BK251 TaxID=2512125 RepID=UPI00104CAEE3|nr:FkbM family methyltransferase [Rhizobium sp. BK251]TCL68337.1 FkbM family methyltransferase [Rhizobium sp. BK251]